MAMTFLRLTMARVRGGSLGLLVLAVGCGGQVSANGGAAGSGGTSATGGSAGTSTTGGSGGTSATGGSAGSSATGGSAGSSATGGAGGSAGGPCKTNQDCAGGICGFPEADACAAQGQCFPAPGAVCSAYSPGCACDGTTINVVCTGLPSGYSTAPLARAGKCMAIDAGAGTQFACGSSLTCDSATEYCKVAEGGPCCNPPSYSCEPIPAACANDYSCHCLVPLLSPSQCSQTNPGGVTVTFQYP